MVEDRLMANGVDHVYLHDVRWAMQDLVRELPKEQGLLVTMFTPAEVYDALEAAMPQ